MACRRVRCAGFVCAMSHGPGRAGSTCGGPVGQHTAGRRRPPRAAARFPGLSARAGAASVRVPQPPRWCCRKTGCRRTFILGSLLLLRPPPAEQAHLCPGLCLVRVGAPGDAPLRGPVLGRGPHWLWRTIPRSGALSRPSFDCAAPCRRLAAAPGPHCGAILLQPGPSPTGCGSTVFICRLARTRGAAGMYGPADRRQAAGPAQAPVAGTSRGERSACLRSSRYSRLFRLAPRFCGGVRLAALVRPSSAIADCFSDTSAASVPVRGAPGRNFRWWSLSGLFLDRVVVSSSPQTSRPEVHVRAVFGSPTNVRPLPVPVLPFPFLPRVVFTRPRCPGYRLRVVFLLPTGGNLVLPWPTLFL